MRRLYELIEAVQVRYPQDPFFKDFRNSCRQRPAKRAHYQTYSDALQLLDDRSWAILKAKAVAHFQDHRSGQTKQGFFNQLNEAFAYRSLRRRGYDNVELLPEQGRRTPDIRYRFNGGVEHCEVKTMGLSDLEIDRRESRRSFSNSYAVLSDGWFQKFQSTIASARAQLAAAGTPGLVYIVAVFDDSALDNYAEYRNQILEVAHRTNLSRVYVKVGLRGNRRLTLGCP